MLSIIVPTLNEARNIPELVIRIHRAMESTGIPYEVLIVDDDSSDNTEGVCNDLGPPVRLIIRKDGPRDLSLAVLVGIESATFDRILVMDADLSHPPEKIVDMWVALQAQPDAFVLGSRYVKGGSFDRSWGLIRFVNSNLATLLARPLVRCADPMSGFFMFDRVRAGELRSMRPIGYKIGLELMVRGDFDEIVEVPIRFLDRARGISKMNLSQQFKYLRHLRRLYLKRFGAPAEFVHFGAVGASGFVIDVTVYYLLQFLGVPHQLARALSFWPAVSWNWVMNRVTTFGDRRRRARRRQWLEFVGSSLLGFSINWGVYVALTKGTEFFDDYRLLALVTGVAAASIFNFTASTLFVYSERRE